jgi:hypothetical protein
LREHLGTKSSGPNSTNCIVHLERTLDEAYYPALTATDFEDRNTDQVVYRRYADQASANEEHMPVPLLMVPQLWLWKFGDAIVSACAMTPSKWVDRDPSDASNHPGLTHISSSLNPDVCMGELIADQIRRFGEATVQEGVSFPPTLDIFETSVVSVLSNVDLYMKTTQPGDIDYFKEREFGHILADIRSELSIIDHILQEQLDIVVALLRERSKSKLERRNDSTSPSASGGPPADDLKAALTSVEMSPNQESRR